MKLQFNQFGWIVAYDEKQGFFTRFDSKSRAKSWVRENPDYRYISSECIVQSEASKAFDSMLGNPMQALDKLTIKG